MILMAWTFLAAAEVRNTLLTIRIDAENISNLTLKAFESECCCFKFILFDHHYLDFLCQFKSVHKVVIEVNWFIVIEIL